MKKIVAVLVFIAFVAVATLVMNGYALNIETLIHQKIIAYKNPGLTDAMIAISEIGDVVFVSAMLIMLLLIPATRFKYGLPIALTVVAAAGLNQLLKYNYLRPRPDMYRIVHEWGYSFPSGHAMNNMALYAMIVFMVWAYAENKWVKLILPLPAFFMAFAIGLSRVYLGVHYAGDVLGGWLMGLFVALTASIICDHFKQFNRSKAI